MPELPEVETVRRGLEPHIVGRTIRRVVVREPRLRWPIPAGFARRLKGQVVRSAGRRAKYLLLGLDRDRLLLHLGMSGRLRWLETPVRAGAHDHLDLEFDAGAILRLNDPRRFGAALVWSADAPSHPLLAHLGPEPLGNDFDGEHLFTRSRGRRTAVKNFLMDGRIVVGVGNIYASESLFRAGIRPGRAAGRVTRAQFARLATSVRAVLGEAIAQGGTTLRDRSFSDANGSFGDFQVKLSVYDRGGKPCPQCGTPLRRSLIGQRSSFWCPRCQH